jgi:hypothetical protein
MTLSTKGDCTRPQYRLEFVPNVFASAALSKGILKQELEEQFTPIVGEMVKRNKETEQGWSYRPNSRFLKPARVEGRVREHLAESMAPAGPGPQSEVIGAAARRRSLTELRPATTSPHSFACAALSRRTLGERSGSHFSRNRMPHH